MLAGAVLTGGSSTRMGADKALVEVDGVAMAARVAHALRASGCVLDARWSAAISKHSAGSARSSSPMCTPAQGRSAGSSRPSGRSEAPRTGS